MTPPPPPAAGRKPGTRQHSELPPLPPGFLTRMQALLGDDAPLLTAALQQPPAAGLRLNPLKGHPTALLQRLPWPLEPLPWCRDGYRLAQGSEPRPGTTALHAAGAFYLQDPSAMAPAAALAPRPGERVCELAAAPGGKTTQLAALMAGRGVLVANEVDGRRSRSLLSNVERWGATHVVVTQERPERFARALPGWFDRVLLDAPCSGEGMFRKSAEARRQWSPALVTRCSGVQASLLDAAAWLLRPGGVLVYSTCTFEPQENAEAVAAFLERHPDFAVDAPALPGAEPAPGGGPGLTLWPHHDVGDGQYLARLVRVGTPQGRAAAAPDGDYGRAVPAPRAARHAWERFAAAVLGADPFPEARLLLHGDRLLAAPAELPPASGLHLLRAGVLLGRWQGHDAALEPAHALALAAPPAGALLSFPEGDPRLEGFLRGVEFDVAGVDIDGAGDDIELESGTPEADGWLRVAVEGMPLGWGRRRAGSVRSLLPRGLRRHG